MAKLFSKLFAKKEEGEEAKKKSFGKGMVIGVIVAVIILVVVLLIVFGGKMFGKKPAVDGTVDASLKYTIVTSKACGDKCWDTGLFFEVLQQAGAKEKSRTTVYIEDKKGQDLVEKFKITQVPTILVAGDIDKDEQLTGFFSALGETIDKTFVLRQVIPPYINAASGQLKGEVAVTFITDNSCAECYDVNLHQTSLANFGVPIANSRTVDAASDEGKSLIEKYNITKVPTIVISGQPDEYQSLKSIWATVGKVADDGTYVFTNLDEMGGSYYDLEKKKVVEAAPATDTPAE